MAIPRYKRLFLLIAFLTRELLAKYVIRMEKQRVVQILSNYISNAVKYTSEGSITVGYYPPINGKIRLYAHDTGCGIPPGKT